MPLSERDKELLSAVAQTADPNAAYELMNRFLRGLPVAHLLPLLQSASSDTVREASWILSELGTGASPLAGEFCQLLQHSEPAVRAMTLDAVLVTGCQAGGEALARAVRCLSDCDAVVRLQAVWFLSKADALQLAMAMEHIRDSAWSAQMDWFMRASEDRESTIIAAFVSVERAERMFAVAAIARLSAAAAARVATAAHTSPYEDVRSLVRSLLEFR